MISYLRSLDSRGMAAGLAAVLFLSGGIFLGSRNLRDYDPILLTYTFGVLFSAFAVAYRYAVWLQRPPTRVYFRRGWGLLFRKGEVLKNLVFMIRSAWANLAAQRFIRKRSFGRWLTHFLLAWGTVIAGAFTFPLVFGWLHFESAPDAPHVYRVVFLGWGLGEFSTRGLWRFVMFNLLNLSAVMVIAGVAMALHKRLRDGSSMARQQFGNDIVPLILLLAISITGLMLTFSMHALKGYGYGVISLIHAVTVTVTLLYIPFGKFFHIFQRPAQLGVVLYRRANEAAPPALCPRCGEAYAGAMHIEDLKVVLPQTGHAAPWMAVCPPCRRRAFGVAQGALLGRGHG